MPRIRLRNFLPSIGRLTPLSRAHGGPGVRVDSGVYEGAEISIYYDPDDRQADRLWRGPPPGDGQHHRPPSTPSRSAASATTFPFSRALLRHPRFVAGRLTTGFIAEEFPDGFQASRPSEEDQRQLLARWPPWSHHRSSCATRR